jgi:hypothetical protein
MLERAILTILLGALAGAAAGWWTVREGRADLDAALAIRPPLAVVDYRAALEGSEGTPEEIARRIAGIDGQVSALEGAGFLGLHDSAVAAAPGRLRAPPPGEEE